MLAPEATAAWLKIRGTASPRRYDVAKCDPATAVGSFSGSVSVPPWPRMASRSSSAGSAERLGRRARGGGRRPVNRHRFGYPSGRGGGLRHRGRSREHPCPGQLLRLRPRPRVSGDTRGGSDGRGPHRPRAISVDGLLGWRLASPRLRALSLIATWAGASAIMAKRRKVLCRENERFPASQSPGTRPDPQAASLRKLAQPAPQSSGDRP